MFYLFLRIVLFILGVALIFDAILPMTTESMRVVEHSYWAGLNDGFGLPTSLSNPRYKLHLAEGRVSSCSVNENVYKSFQDGETVKVQTTMILRVCDRVMKIDEFNSPRQFGKFIFLISGILIIVGALGIMKLNSDD
jgi:hypothetical protein